MRQNQREVVKNVARGVGADRDIGGGAIQRDGEETERRADAEVAADQTSLNERIPDVQVILTLVALIADGFTDQSDEVAIALARGIGARQILIGNVRNRQRSGGVEQDVERVIAPGRIVNIHGIFRRQARQKQHPVVARDADELF